MNIFVYGDESGVFDQAHYSKFVFGGLVFLGKDERDLASRMFVSAERKISPSYDLSSTHGELKGSILSAKHKTGLFRSLAHRRRFAFVVDLDGVNENIFGDKKTKQRYLDYVFKVGLKRMLGCCIRRGEVNPRRVESVYVRFDEHTTATNGRYELGEAMEQEFKRGTVNYKYNTFHPPLFPGMPGGVELTFKDSSRDALIRASDIIANVALYHELHPDASPLPGNVFVTRFP